MYCFSKNSKKYYHLGDCIYVSHIKKYNRIWAYTREEVEAQGYVLCPKCSKLYKQYKQEQEFIDMFMQRTGFIVFYEDNSVYIKTNMKTWKIITSGKNQRLHLYHESNQIYSFCKKENGKIEKRYHLQNDIHSKTIERYLMYIEKHDQWRYSEESKYKQLPKNTKKQRKRYRQEKGKAKRKAVLRVLNIIEEMEFEEKIGQLK